MFENNFFWKSVVPYLIDAIGILKSAMQDLISSK
jgi:hypothetical protein